MGKLAIDAYVILVPKYRKDVGEPAEREVQDRYSVWNAAHPAVRRHRYGVLVEANECDLRVGGCVECSVAADLRFPRLVRRAHVGHPVFGDLRHDAPRSRDWTERF